MRPAHVMLFCSMLCLICAVGCGSPKPKKDTPPAQQPDKRFAMQVITGEKSDAPHTSVLVDPETGIEYLYVWNFEGAPAITPRLMPDGKPKLHTPQTST